MCNPVRRLFFFVKYSFTFILFENKADGERDTFHCLLVPATSVSVQVEARSLDRTQSGFPWEWQGPKCLTCHLLLAQCTLASCWPHEWGWAAKSSSVINVMQAFQVPTSLPHYLCVLRILFVWQRSHADVTFQRKSTFEGSLGFKQNFVSNMALVMRQSSKILIVGT